MARPRLRKRLGQHHLRHPSLCDPAVAFLRAGGGTVVEIGPGGGVLTRRLLAAGSAVLAVELDPPWAFELGRELAGERLSLVVADAVGFPWGRLPAPMPVAGNLPYNAATAIVREILPHRATVGRAAFLVQAEVAERLVAGPGDPAYGSLSVLTRAWAEARLLGRVGRGSFRPPPRVDGAFVGLELREPPLPRPVMARFEGWLQRLFGMRRKTLRNVLRRLDGDAAVMAAAGVGIDLGLRAEALGLDDLVRLFRAATAADDVR